MAVPCLMIRHGKVAVPGEEGPVIARGAAGSPLDLFDVVDRLAPRYPRLYVVDLDGVEHGDPQLDYLQEIARDSEVWLDAGVRTASDAIDALVTGAARAVVTSSLVRSSRTLASAWNLSQDIAFELELRNGLVDAHVTAWRGQAPDVVISEVRAMGIRDIIVSNREGPIDWALVQRLSRTGPTWVGGSFEPSELPELGRWGAVGGIFHLTSAVLDTGTPTSSQIPESSPRRRDDEN